jgi:hypothetical protein
MDHTSDTASSTMPTSLTATHAKPPFLCVSGIYPHLAAWNYCTDPASPWFAKPHPECGIGAVVPWAGRLWYLTYTSHQLGRGSDQLFSVAPDRSIEARPESAGGTHACRFIHRPSNQLFIGCYAIAADGTVRVIDRDKLPGRLTAIAAHLTDPANKVYYYTQECSLYEVDVHSLEATLLFVKPLPGWHAKGAYTAQGVLVVAHNGEEPGPSPFWSVDYANLGEVVHEVEAHLKTPITYGPEEQGVLGEWDGREWRVIARRQFNDVMGAGGGGIASSDQTDEPIWAQGWDRRSVLLQVRHGGQWTTYRLPKGSYTYDGFNGSYTEWPRFRDVGDGRWLMNMHGTFFAWPAGFRPGATGGLRPICTYQRYIPDFCRLGEELVLAGQDTSRHGVPWAVPGHSHSNLQFIAPDELEAWGPRSGFGGVWRETPVVAGGTSDPFLVAGYDQVCLHVAHDAAYPVAFTIEADATGDGTWRACAVVSVPAMGYRDHIFAPGDVPAAWIRVRADRNCVATAYLHLASSRMVRPGESRMFAGITSAAEPGGGSGGLLHVSGHNHNLCVLMREYDADGRAGGEVYAEIDERLTFHRLPDSPHAQDVQREAPSEVHVTAEPASLVAIGADGRRFRLPHSPTGRSRVLPWTPRDVREVLQERALANLGGTFYEIPRLGVQDPPELRNLPDYSRMRPIASHDLEVIDFTIWRGLLVLSGVRADARPDGHVFRDGGLGLWFGAFDDLWKLGPPVGVGGPWLDTPVAAGVPSDPYLMTGFARKTLRLSHKSRRAVAFRLEVDSTGDGTFFAYASFTVPPEEIVTFTFPDGYQAHWLRLVPERSTVATAQLTYTGN